MRLISWVKAIHAAILFQAAHAQIEAHHLMSPKVYHDDVMSMQVWVDGHLVCKGGETIAFSSDESDWCMRNHDGQSSNGDCAPGYSWCATNNGRTGKLEYFVDSKIVWTSPEMAALEAEIYKTDNCEPVPVSKPGDDPATSLPCYDWETCGTTHGDLNKCKLCDGKAICEEMELDPPKVFPYPKYFNALIVGDSLTQGHEGDYTWRYRLWEWLSKGAGGRPGEQLWEVDFVGPWQGTYPTPDEDDAIPKPPPLKGEKEPESTRKTSGGAYAKDVSSDFPDRHLARWGMAAKTVKDAVISSVAFYEPTHLILMVGFNDIGWFYSDAEGTLKTLEEIVKGAQGVKPDIKILVANIVHRTAIGGREDLVEMTTAINQKLPSLVNDWSTDDSVVKLVDVASAYDCGTGGCPDGYDGLHPNERGEYHIARKFSEVIYDTWGIGQGHLNMTNVQIPSREPIPPSNFAVLMDPIGIKASWDKVFGAFGYEVRSRLEGSTDWGAPIRIDTNAYYLNWVLDGQTWEVTVRTVMGDDYKSDWLKGQSVRAFPTAPVGPQGIVTTPLKDSIKVKWKKPTDYPVDVYGVIWYDQTEIGFAQSLGTKDTSVEIEGLAPGHRYTVMVQCWNAIGGGAPRASREVLVGRGTPAIPKLTSVKNVDATTVKLTWTADEKNSAGYRVWVRSLKNGKPAEADEYGTTSELTHTIWLLFPGTWNYEFCVSAYNGDAESPKSNCIIPEEWKE